MGQIGFELRFVQIQLREGFRLRLKADYVAQAVLEQHLVRRLAIDRICADIDDLDQPIQPQYFLQVF